ncbi:MAG: hypothetical protein CVU06_03475, partial [Bacteroidetes bacterium HGW-Bacteroidetes-22]
MQTSLINYNYNALNLLADAYAQTNPEIGLALNGSVPFSIDAWVQFKGLGNETSILSKNGVFNLGIDGYSVICQIKGFPTVWSDSKNDPVGERDWHYICVTFDGSQLRIYIDGKFNTLTGISGSGSSNTEPYLIGHNLQGLVREVRVYNKSLYAEDVLNNMYNDPDPLSITAYFDFTQNPPIDRSEQHLPISLENDAQIITVSPALFVPSTAYVQPLQDEAINPGGFQNDAYTVQTWVYINSRISPKQFLFVNSDLERDTGMALFLELDEMSMNYKVKSQRGSDASADNILTSNGSITIYKWINLATTFDGVNLSIYIDGVLDITQPFLPIALIEDNSNLLIGAALTQGRPTGADGLDGYISRVDVWDKALSESEVLQFMNEVPDVPTENLTANYNFMVSPVRNLVNGHPIGLADGAVIDCQTSKAAPQAGSDKTEPELYKDISPEMLQSFRRSINFDNVFKVKGNKPFKENINAELSFARQFLKEKDIPGFKEKIEKAWNDMEEKMRNNPQSIPFTVTNHRIDGYYVFVCHNSRGSYVAGKIKTSEISPCDLWKINLFFVVIAGILDALFGVSAKLTTKATNYILRVIANPKIATLLAGGTVMTASAIFSIGKELYNYGFLRELVKLLIDIGFWTIIRIVAKILLTFAGFGAADVIASLVATAATFIKVYLERPASCDPLPIVDIAAIQFNHVVKSATYDAIDIRKNNTQPVDVPEWVANRNIATESPAAYSIAGVSTNPIKIKAKFMITSADNIQAEIRATGGGILGAVDSFTVNFKSGVSNPEFIEVSLPHQTIGTNGVNKEDIQWQWQYKLSGGAWTNMTASNHRIYSILQEPTRPWEQIGFPNNNQLPWTDVLDYACVWAAGKKTADDVTTAITEKVNGQLSLKYDINSGASKYTDIISYSSSVFLCKDFIDYLTSGTG